MTEQLFEVITREEDTAARLDKTLARHLPHLSRSRLQGLLEGGQVSLGEATIDDGARKVKPGECYRVNVPPPTPSHILPQALALDIVYEDADFLVINKAPGMTVHPAPGSPDHTLVNALLAHCGASLSGVGGVARPGIVHRIDKETSGLLVVAKHDQAHNALAAQLQSRVLKRTYLAVCVGLPAPAEGTIIGAIGRSAKNRQKMAIVKTGGKDAVTHYKVKEAFVAGGQPIASLVECELDTGRTHQIRVHMASQGNAILGDPLYGSGLKLAVAKKYLPDSSIMVIQDFKRQALHAWQLRLLHPVSEKPMHFEAKIPNDMKALIEALQSKQ